MKGIIRPEVERLKEEVESLEQDCERLSKLAKVRGEAYARMKKIVDQEICYHLLVNPRRAVKLQEQMEAIDVW